MWGLPEALRPGWQARCLGTCAFSQNPLPGPRALWLYGEAGPECSASGFSTRSQQSGCWWELPDASNPVWAQIPTFTGLPPLSLQQRQGRTPTQQEPPLSKNPSPLRKNPHSEEEPHVSALTRGDLCTTRAAAISKCLIWSQTICNRIKSFPNHSPLSKYKNPERPNKMKSARSDFFREKCSLMSPFKRDNYFCRRNNHCNHLLTLLVPHSNCFNNKNKTRALPICRQKSCLLGNWASSHLPTPTLPLSKGISEPAIWELGNSTLFLANLWMQFWH